MTQLDHRPTSAGPHVSHSEHRVAPEVAEAVGHALVEALPDFHQSGDFATDLTPGIGDRLFLEDQLKMLDSVLEGRVVTPEQAEYDSVRAIVPGNYDPKPKAVIRVANASDVAASLDFARVTGLEVAVRSGGHSGHSSTHTGLVIDLRDLNGLEIDSIGRTAWAGTGLTAGEVTRAVEKHGLIVGFGDTASVGIGGITCGGGIGYLVRKHGLTIDSVVAAEVVIANGDILIADEKHHADLFWALRGGGGNFGVVTRWKFRLHPLPSFTGGPLVLPATPEIVSRFVALAEAAPEELSAIASVMPAPPLPFLPAEVHGKTVLLCMMAYVGESVAAEQAIAPFRALATPFADLIAPGPYSSVYMEDLGHKPSFSVRSRLMDVLGAVEAAKIIKRVERSSAPMRLGEIRVLGGAMARVPADATAFAHRSSRVMFSFIAIYSDPREQSLHDSWAMEGINQLSEEEDRVYVNFLLTDPDERIHAAYPPATWERLRRVKREYDPENLLRRNRNVLPA
ncbi:FAD-binding oxidoreductase [Bauldia litoralis]|uniref:FAD/FMN-containing dehydrogenase n=1 Tax=Bauldia litoralis TaxID=665467 RepID=A0A1G6EQC8_9HYPH|nr:FAD-binding oxidoreductase [Bauldia litoralis]SDB59578.1 FAD/FMN-containing dehydrogenase [Bauldia litoralis]